MGHASVAITDKVYAHLRKKDYAAQRARFSAFVTGASTPAADHREGPPVGQRDDGLDLAHQRYVERLTGVMTGRVEDEADASTPTRSAPASDQPAVEELH